MNKKYLGFLVATLASASLLSTLAVGQGNQGGQGQNQGPAGQLKEEIQEKKQEMVMARCQISVNRIAGLVATYEGNKTSWENMIINSEEVLNKISAQLAELGGNTSQLNAYIIEWKTMLESNAGDKDTIISKLKEAKGFACGESQGEYRARLQEAKQLRTALVASRRNARDFFINTVKPEIKRLREEVRTMLQAEGTTETETETE